MAIRDVYKTYALHMEFSRLKTLGYSPYIAFDSEGGGSLDILHLAALYRLPPKDIHTNRKRHPSIPLQDLSEAEARELAESRKMLELKHKKLNATGGGIGPGAIGPVE